MAKLRKTLNQADEYFIKNHMGVTSPDISAQIGVEVDVIESYKLGVAKATPNKKVASSKLKSSIDDRVIGYQLTEGLADSPAPKTTPEDPPHIFRRNPK